MRRVFRFAAVMTVAIILWQGLILVTGLPPFLLPGPEAVLRALIRNHTVLARGTLYTATEILAGFALGAATGSVLAIIMASFVRLARVLRPVLLLSQVIPIFALAPIMTLWLGYGMEPKIAIAALICFFPVASAFLDGLERTSPAALDLARTMGVKRWRIMLQIRIPAALPMLGSGLKLAAVYAPIGAVIGEWVGGSAGLGAVMIHSNGRMQIDTTFAALALVTLMALAFYTLVNTLVEKVFARFQPA